MALLIGDSRTAMVVDDSDDIRGQRLKLLQRLCAIVNRFVLAKRKCRNESAGGITKRWRIRRQ